MTNVAVVILNYNGEKFLRQFLPSVIQNSGEAEIIVADNASTDASLKVLREEFPTVRVLVLSENYGFCGGYNKALKEVDANYYVLLNSDVEVTPHWLVPLVSLMENNSTVGAVQPKIKSYYQRNTFEYAGAGGGYLDRLGYPFCRGRLFDYLEEDTGQYNDEREVFWATGACMLVRSSLYRELRGFDEDFFAHMEEIDLCWRMKKLGYSIYYQGKSTVYHVGGGTLSKLSPRKTFLNFRNGLFLLYKNYSTTALLWKLPLRMLLDDVALLRFLLSKQPDHAMAIFKAHIYFFKNIRSLTAKRKLIKRVEKENKVGTYAGSIVWDFFVLKKRKVIPD